MASLIDRRSRVLGRMAAVSFASALAVLTFAGPTVALSVATPGVAHADPDKPGHPKPSHPTKPADPTTSGEPTESADPTAPGEPSTPGDSLPEPSASESSAAPIESDAPAADPIAPDRTERVKSPGKITCEDLGLGATLQKVNGARNNKVVTADVVSSVVKDTDVDRDGDPDSLFVTVDEGVVATAVVALHGNRANIYEGSFEAGVHGPFYSPSQPNDVHPPVTHRLVCGLAASPSELAASPTPSEDSEASGGGGGLPVTGLALTGLVLAGLSMVGAGVAMRALRRKNSVGDNEPTDV